MAPFQKKVQGGKKKKDACASKKVLKISTDSEVENSEGQSKAVEVDFSDV
jgi:hypothetical protein